MKRLLLSIGLAAFVFSSPAVAQEPPEAQLDFVRKLRQKGYADLALQYLETIPASSPAIGSAILLEKVRTRVALSRSLEPERRVAMIDQARGELEQFIKTNTGPAEIIAAKLERARLSTFQGQAILSRALREEGSKAQQEMALPAEQMFIQAGKEIEEATKNLKDDDERRQARFDLAINMMDQARTYIDLSRNDLNAKRAQIVDNARKIFEKVYEEEKKSALGLLSAAWLVKCCQEGDDPQNAKKYFKAVMESTSRSAEPAQRWARYFRMEGIPRDPTLKLKPDQKILEIEREAQAWLKEYPSHHKTPAGYGVRYELAKALYFESQGTKDAKLQAIKVKQAQEVLSSMNESDNDFAEKASQLNIALSLKTIGEKSAVTELNTFDECFLRAQVELNQVKKIAGSIEDAKSKEEGDKFEKQRQESFRTIIRSLSRGLALADSKVPPSKLDEARFYLVASYLMSGDQYRAAIAGEAMAQTQPPTAKSPLAAGYAIEAYASIYNRDKSDNNRARLQKLADYVLSPEMQKQWANDSVTGVAHYQLAMLLSRDGNARAAVEHLQKLPKEFPGYVYAQGQLVFMLLEARDKAQKPEEKQKYQEQVRKTLAAMPKPTPAMDASSTTMYFHTQLEEAKFLYADAADLLQKNDPAKALQKYQQMAAFVDALSKELATPNLKLAEDKDKVAYYLDTMRKYSRLGLAEVDYRNGQYDKVLGPEQTGTVVEQIKKQAAAGGLVRVKDLQVTGDILGLALRAYVQKGKVDEAKQVLKLLEVLRGPEENEAFANSTGVLKNLVGELKDQLRELQKSGNKEQLKKTVANFSDFVDALVKQAEKKGMEKSDIFFLARCYDSLDQHDKAAALYARYPTPKFLDVKKKEKEKFSPEEETELQTYWTVKVSEARQLRLAKKFSESKKIIDFLTNHKNARQQLRAEKEQNHLLEEEGLFGKAITRWSSFMNNPTLKQNLGNDPALKEVYFDAYYHLALCWYKYSQTQKVKDANKDAQFLNKAADYIIRLESSANQEGWQIAGPKFRSLMATETMLADAYKRQKGS